MYNFNQLWRSLFQRFDQNVLRTIRSLNFMDIVDSHNNYNYLYSTNMIE